MNRYFCPNLAKIVRKNVQSSTMLCRNKPNVSFVGTVCRRLPMPTSRRGLLKNIKIMLRLHIHLYCNFHHYLCPKGPPGTSKRTPRDLQKTSKGNPRDLQGTTEGPPRDLWGTSEGPPRTSRDFRGTSRDLQGPLRDLQGPPWTLRDI